MICVSASAVLLCRRRVRAAALALAAVLLSGCASLPEGHQPDPRDPWEGYNRAMHGFNDGLDRAVLKPVATFYQDVTPRPVRTGVDNFFSNLGDAWSFVNNVLQGKPEGAFHSFWRVLINSTVGLGGVLDPATEMRLQRHREDFGQTLGVWGVGPGPYLVLPLLGPSTLRDGIATPVDFYGHPAAYLRHIRVRNSLIGLRTLSLRASAIGVTDVLEAAALDAYSFQRDAYLQKRRNDIYDGNPPQDEERYDLDPEDGASTSQAPEAEDGQAGGHAATASVADTSASSAPASPGSPS